jgi:hypothetical protein
MLTVHFLYCGLVGLRQEAADLSLENYFNLLRRQVATRPRRCVKKNDLAASTTPL